MTPRRFFLYALPILAFVLLIGWMANGPLYRAYSIEGCREAYAEALDRSDTARVDQHPYRNERDNRRVRHRCGELRTSIATDSIPLIGARSPGNRP